MGTFGELCEQENMDREGHLDQGAEEEEEGLVEGGEHEHEVQQSDQHRGEYHCV